MTDNVFAPPKSNLDGAPGPGEQAPPLWNPNAAANWSLLLSAAFGAYLHMKNWQALGEQEKARQSRAWMIAVVAILALSIFAGAFLGAGVGNLVGFVLLITWYLTSARAQAAYVKERFGSRYPRRGWVLPIVVGLVVVVLGGFSIGIVAAIIQLAIAR